MPRPLSDASSARAAVRAWVTAECSELQTRRPSLVRLATWLAQRPTLSLIVMAALVGGALQPFASEGDSLLFGRTADQLVSSDGLDVFTAPATQVGPAYLAVLAAIRVFARACGLPLWFTTGAVQSALVCALALAAGRSSRARDSAGDRAGSLARDWALGLAIVAGGLMAEAVLNGHLEEVATGLLLVVAGNKARRGSAVAAGLLIGLAGVLKLWGFLGVALMVLAVPRRTALRGAATAAVVGVGAYLPFFAWGTVHTFDFEWRISRTSTLGLLTGHTDVFDFRWRAAQAAVAVAFALFLSARGLRPAMVVAGLITVRLLGDPQTQMYYVTALVVVLLVAACSADKGRTAAWVAVTPLTVLGPYLAGEMGGAVLRSAALAVLAVVLVRIALRAGAETAGIDGLMPRPRTALDLKVSADRREKPVCPP